MIKDLRVTKGTVARTVLTVVVLINLVLKATGHDIINLDEYSVSTVIENLVNIGVIVLGFWKNNSFTLEAKNADFYLAKLKNFDTDEADEIFDREG